MYQKTYSEKALTSLSPAFEELSEAEINVNGGGSIWGATADSISAYPMSVVNASMDVIHASVQAIHTSFQYVHNVWIKGVIHDTIFEPFIPGTNSFK